jgi:hypothetical protein
MKVHKYRCAAEFHNVMQPRPSILVLAANQLTRVKSAIEDTGSLAGNSRQKLDEATIFVELYSRDDGFRKYVELFCSTARLQEFRAEKVFIAGDDTCVYLPDSIWQSFKATAAAQAVNERLIVEADKEVLRFEVDGKAIVFGGPGVSTSYFISALGMEGYREALYLAGEVAGLGYDYPILRKSTLTVRCLVRGEKASKFDGTSLVQLIAPEHPNRKAFAHEVYFDNAFLARYRHPQQPLSESTDYASEFDSYAQAFTGFLDSSFPPKRSFSDNLPRQSGHLSWLRIQHMGDGAKQNLLRLPGFPEFQLRHSPHIDSRSPAGLLNLDPHIASSDAFVLTPPASTEPSALRWWGYTMFSLIVAIKTHPRDAEKIVIIMADAAALRFVQLYFDLANHGWTDDYPTSHDGLALPDGAMSSPTLRHVQTGLCHFLLGEDADGPFPLAEALRAASDILKTHEARAIRLREPRNKYHIEPIASELTRSLAPADVAFMCTSHSERREVHEDCSLIGEFLASRRFSAIWPGNDRNNMSSLYSSLRHCPRLIGVITEHLADAATWNGQIPECTHPIMASHIYERTFVLICLGLTHIILPIGVGGMLEISSRMLLDDYFPDFRSRPAIFYNPAYAWNKRRDVGFMEQIVAAFLGDLAYQNMTKGTYRDDDGGDRPYYATDKLERVYELIDDNLRAGTMAPQRNNM